jgi:hypothetical protein
MMQALSQRMDGWKNVVLGIGGVKDPSTFSTFIGCPPLDDVTLEALYVNDHFAAQVIELLPRSALRPGWDLIIPGKPEETADARQSFQAMEDDLGVVDELENGAYWGRCFGGAITWIGADDGRSPEQPLDENRIKSIRFLHTFDRRDLRIEQYYSDASDRNFRKPELFRILPTAATLNTGFGATGSTSYFGAVVHESRCLVWPGQPTTEDRRRVLNGWEDSVIQRTYEALRQIGENYSASSMLLGRISQAIYKIRDFYAMIAGNREDVLRRRMDIIEQSRSRSRAILLDTEESFENVSQPMSGVENVIDRSILRLASAARIPVSVLMGQSPQGMNASAEGDLEIWADEVLAWQRLELRPRHERLTKLMLLAKDGPTAGVEPEFWLIRYRALRTPRPIDLAQVRSLETSTDVARINAGLVTPEAVALARFSPGSGGDLTLDEAELRANLDRRRQLANQPPKDNAEMGTVGARTSAVIDIISKVVTGQIPRVSGLSMLTELHRYTPETAVALLGPEDFVARPDDSLKSPGPAPSPPNGSGAGAPQGLPNHNAGGAQQAA